MKTYTILKEFTFEGKDYEVGETIQLDELKAKPLVAQGKIKLV
jgi:hypothetical protein